MARRRKKSDVIDGFITMEAARRAAASGPKRKKATAKPTAPKKRAAPRASKPKSDGKVKIGRTIEPTKNEIVCYECEYAFTLTGELNKTYCPKCRCILEAKTETIDGVWSGGIRTIGDVVIAENGIVRGGTVVARNVVLKGSIESGRVRVLGRLDVHPGGNFELQVVDAVDLVIREGSRVALTRKARFRHVEIEGELKAKLDTTGIVTIRQGALLRGQLRGAHLVVEEGGGLKAKLAIGEDNKALE